MIFHSLESRKATGALTNTIPVDKSIKEVVFKLKQTGAKPKLKEVQVSQEELDRIAREGPVIDQAKLKKDDLIYHSLEARIKVGSLTSTTTVDKSIKEVVFKLK